MTEIRSYEQANEYLGKKNSRPLRYKTRVERLLNETIAIRHHDTDIIVYRLNGVVVIDTQGWHTKTTKDRLNAHLPGRGIDIDPASFRVHQRDNIWYLTRQKPDPNITRHLFIDEFVFKDGMRILADGTVEGAGPPKEELKKLNKEILKYSREYIKALFAGEVPKPSGGDCWYCLLKTQTGETMGEMLRGRENTEDNHIVGHFEEKYYVPSLLVRAIEIFPVSNAAKWALGDFWLGLDPGDAHPPRQHESFYGIAKEQLRSSLRRYLRRQLGLAS